MRVEHALLTVRHGMLSGPGRVHPARLLAWSNPSSVAGTAHTPERIASLALSR